MAEKHRIPESTHSRAYVVMDFPFSVEGNWGKSRDPASGENLQSEEPVK